MAGWGDPSLIQAGTDYGYAAYMPQGAHGCFVDYQGNIWVGGNGDGIVQEYNPQAANTAGANATFRDADRHQGGVRRSRNHQ